MSQCKVGGKIKFYILFLLKKKKKKKELDYSLGMNNLFGKN